MSHQLSLGRSFFLRLPTSLDRKLKLRRNSQLGDDQKTQMESHWIWFMDVYGVGLIH